MKTMEQQIELFKEQTDLQLEIVDGKPYYDGNIYIHNNNTNAITFPDNFVVNGSLNIGHTNIKEIPKGLVIKGYLNIRHTNIKELPEDIIIGTDFLANDVPIEKLPDNFVVNGSLDLANTNIVELPKGLVVKGYLDISFTEIKELPEDIIIGGSLYASSAKLEKLPDDFVVNGDLDIANTNIKELPNDIVISGSLFANNSALEKLPDNFVVKGNLDIAYTNIIELPNDIIIGGSLYAENTSLERLPENLKVGGSLRLQNSMVKELPSGLEVGGDIYMSEYIKDGMEGCEFDSLNKLLLNDSYKRDYIEWAHKSSGRKFCKVDYIFTEILEEKGSVKKVKLLDDNEELYLVTDGDGNYAHGYTIQEAKDDLIYKISNRDKSDYKGLSLDSVLTHKEAIKCYRVITGACSAGTKDFVENILGKNKKDKYTIQEMIDLTKGQFGNEEFVKFFLNRD